MVYITIAAALIAASANTVVGLISGKGAFVWLLRLFKRKTITELLLFNRAVFLNSIMWYLLAMVYAYIIMGLLVRTGLIGVMLPAAVLLITVNLYWCEFTGHPWYQCGNFLFEILPLVIIGFHFDRLRKFHVPLWVQAVILTAGVVCSIVEIFVFYYDAPLFIGSIISAVTAFYICLENAPIPDNMASRFGRRYSMLIFILHCSLRDLLKAILPNLSDSALFPIVVLLFSAGIAVVIYPLLKKLKRCFAGKIGTQQPEIS